MCKRELFEQLGEGYSDDFIGTVDGLGSVFFKKGVKYRNVCLRMVRRYEHEEDMVVDHVWVDILQNDISYKHIKKGQQIVVFGIVESYTRKNGTSDIGLRTYTIKRVLERREINGNIEKNSNSIKTC